MADKLLLCFPPPTKLDKRAKLGNPGPPKLHSPSEQRQGERLAPKFNDLRRSFSSPQTEVRQTPAGTTIEQVVVFETVGSVESFRTAIRHTPGMNFLADWAEEDIPPDEDFYLEDEKKREEHLSGRLYLVMSNQHAIEQMLSLWNRYQRDSKEKFDRGLNAWKALFVQLRDVRRWGVKDRLEETGILQDWEEQVASHTELVRFEAELWCKETEQLRDRTFEGFRQIVEEENGQCIAQSYIPEISYHGILVEAPLEAINPILKQRETKLVRAEEVMFFRPLGQSAFDMPEGAETLTDGAMAWKSLPEESPVVALLDGMPLENHERLAGRLIVDDPDGWTASYQANERHHGTAMASLIVHGELDALEEPLQRPVYVRPILKPDPRGWQRPRRECIPSDVLPIDLFYRAIRRIVEGDGKEPPVAPQVRIVNLSVGDPTQPFNRYISPWARLLDWLAWKYNLTFIVSAGNYFDDITLGVDRRALNQLDSFQLQAETLKAVQANERYRALLAPAEAINAITVGALHSDRSVIPQRGHLLNLYEDGFLPSPYSRVGPGFRRSIKPDIFVSGGRALYGERLGNQSSHAVLQGHPSLEAPGHRVACPGQQGGDTSACYYTRGTSNAAALASRAGALLYDNLLNLKTEPDGERLDDNYMAVLLKTLLVHSAHWKESYKVFQDLFGNRFKNEGIFKDYIGRYLGYGTLEFSRTIACTDQRATIIGWGTLTDGAADQFRIPLPPSLGARKIWRRFIITLAWNSPINPRHQKYRQARLWFRPNKSSLHVKDENAWWQTVERGTVQHVVMEGNSASVFVDGDALELQVNCMADAGKMKDRIPYGIAVTLEVAEGATLPIYDEIRTRLRLPVRIGAPDIDR